MPVDHDDERGVLLQPRGRTSIAVGHYKRSMRQGISLDEYADQLKDQLDELRLLYPDGIARLWGATPATRKDEKSAALRDRRVGDDVLFYGEKAFFSWAKIGLLFRNPEAARVIWGADDGEATWEFMMALVDVREFDPPIPANELGVPSSLRSLRMATAEQLKTIGARLEEVPRMAREVPESSASGKLTYVGLMTLLTGKLSPAGIVAVLWMIGDRSVRQSERPRMIAWPDFRDRLGPVLLGFGMAEAPEVPFLNLGSSGFWEIDGVEAGHSGIGDEDATAGFTSDADKLLLKTKVKGEVIARLLMRLPAGIDKIALLKAVGLEAFATASGWLPTTRRGRHTYTLDRDLENVRTVKEMHHDACQVCGVRLETRNGFRSDAAHIRGLGKPHEGPDEVSNLLCLCPNHHAQFDSFGIYIDEEFEVRRTRDRERITTLRREAVHPLDEEHIAYHRSLCGRNTDAGRS